MTAAAPMPGDVPGAVPHPSLREATRVWAKIGLLSFGGPAGQIALMHRTLVEEKRWVPEGSFLHALNFCMLLPGPEAQQLATYIGWLLHGVRGGIVAGTLFVLPGLAVILVLSALYAHFHETLWLESLFFGLKPAVLAIVIEAVIRIGRRALNGPAAWLVAAAAFLGIYVFRVPFPAIVAAAALVGVGAAAIGSNAFTPPAGRGAGASDDRGAHGGGLASHLARAAATIAIWGGIWAAPVVVAGLAFGWSSILPALGLFFSKLAVVTFGGAYAALAYVADAAVTGFGWLKPGEMLDGLAMAETTPGPLVIVLSFVGFVAAFRAPAPLDPMLAGILGGLMVAWVTFVPSFLWIFLGAPYVERLRTSPVVSAALGAVTAAVVGVILNLAVWFGVHVLFGTVVTVSRGPLALAWPDWSSLDPRALLLMAVAAVMLFVFRRGIPLTLAVSAALGIALRLAF